MATWVPIPVAKFATEAECRADMLQYAYAPPGLPYVGIAHNDASSDGDCHLFTNASAAEIAAAGWELT